jgi:two-component system CheB/CheR fusion protein
LRQPAQAALLVASVLEAGSRRAEQKRMARHVAAALESLCEMLETLALLSRIEAGLQSVPLHTCQLADVLEDVLRGMADIAAQRGIRLRIRSFRGLVRSNPKLLGMATRSLLLNAIKFGSGDEILASCRRRGGRLRLEVQFESASLAIASDRNAIVQLSPATDRPVAGEVGFGLSLLEHLCGRLGHSLHHLKLPPDGHLLAMELPLAPASV